MRNNNSKVIIFTDFKMICKGKDVYLKDTTYFTMQRYKKVFGKVVLCTRNYPNEKTNGYVLANDVVDEVIPISGLFNTLVGKHNKEIRLAISTSNLVIARVPSIVAYRAVEIAKKMQKPVFSVAIGCAWDAYWNHRFPGKLIAPYMYFKMKWCMKKADYALYVTEKFLQKRYPSECKSIGVSDVVVKDFDSYILKRRRDKIENGLGKTITLMTSGSVGNKAKGQEFVIKAIPILNNYGFRINYLLAGGDDPSYLKKLANKLHVEDQISFLGMLSTSEVFEKLDVADIYIQPSLQEGLPRAVVEAMSRGCPVIGTKTGGIPELINKEFIVERKSKRGIAAAIIAMWNTKTILNEANYNFSKSQQYKEELLSNKRNEYYEYIKTRIDY